MKTAHTIELPILHREDFPYRAEELSAFSFGFDTFIISLKDRRIIRYETSQPEAFYRWLIKNGVRDIDG